MGFQVSLSNLFPLRINDFDYLALGDIIIIIFFIYNNLGPCVQLNDNRKLSKNLTKLSSVHGY